MWLEPLQTKLDQCETPGTGCAEEHKGCQSGSLRVLSQRTLFLEQANGGQFEGCASLFQSGNRRGPEIRPSLFWVSRHVCFVGRLAVCGDDPQGGTPKSEGRGDESSGVGQRTRRSPQLVCVLLGWLRLGFGLRRQGIPES